MGDGIKAMYEDYEQYEELCIRYGQSPITNMNGNYYLHQRWVMEFFENKSTTLAWEEYFTKQCRKYGVQKENPDSPGRKVRAGECGDSFGECVQ